MTAKFCLPAALLLLAPAILKPAEEYLLGPDSQRQDGGGFVTEEGRWRAHIVFDNLIHKREMPPTIGIFINPGVLPATSPDRQARFNRSFEYDALGDRYARFLIEEVLPEVASQYTLSSDPN